MEFKRTDLTPKIHWLDFQEQAVMGETFCRFEEHYEGPEHAGTIFTLDEYAEWYKENTGDGEFSYYTDWWGYNMPSRILFPFRAGLFDPLSIREQKFLNELSDVGTDHYIIGTFLGNPGTLKHEVAHALFTTEPKYVHEVLRILGRTKLTPIFETIERHGYAGVTWVDEAHAYLTECPFLLRDWGLNIRPYRKAVRRLQDVFNRWTPVEETKNLDPWIDHDTRKSSKVTTV